MDVEASGQPPVIEELEFFSDWYPNPRNFDSPGSFVIDSYSDSDCTDPFLEVGGDVADLGALIDGSLETLSEADVREFTSQSNGEEVQTGGLRLVGIDSDSDSDYLDSEDPNSFESDSSRNGIGEFELDENDRDVSLEEVITASDNFSDEAADPEIRNFEWEFLLEIINSRRDLVVDFDPYMVNQDEDVSTVEPDRFVEATFKGSPPAAKAVVENLPLISISEDDLQKNGGVCSVCKDEVPVGESVKMLPCLHYYHIDCILPWLEIRNSCPVCRFELPTDDLEYERIKMQSAEGGSVAWDPQVRLDFELFT